MIRKLALVILLLIVAVIAVVAVFGGSYLRTRVEMAVKYQLELALGPAKSYDVRTSGGLLQLVRGRIESLDVTGSGVRLPNGVTLERLDINTKSLAVDPRTGAVDNIGSMRFIALVSQNELSNYLAKSNPEIHDLDLALNNDGFILRASPELRDVRIPVELTGKVKIENDTQVVLDIQGLKASGLRTPGLLQRLLEVRLNPLMDTARWDIPVKLDSAIINEGMLTVSGDLDLMAARRQLQDGKEQGTL